MPHLTEVAFAFADKVKSSFISAVRYVLLDCFLFKSMYLNDT